jgi:hypothetical protein
MAFWGSNGPNYAADASTDDALGNASNNNTWGTGLASFGDSSTLANGFPLVLTDPASLSPQAQAGLLNDGIQQVILMGGTVAVTTNVENQIKALGITVIRLAGANRSDTAAKAAALETGTFSDLPMAPATSCAASSTTAPSCTKPIGLFFDTSHVDIARGDDAGGGADALAGGPHAGGIDSSHGDNPEFEGPAPILLTQDPATLSTATHDYLVANSTPKTNSDSSGPTPNGGITNFDVFGQTAAISNTTAAAALNALTGV